MVRVAVPGVVADSPAQAIDLALERTDLYAACQGGGHEFSEDVAYYLVDEIRDGEVPESRWFEDRHHTPTQLLQRLLRHLDNAGEENYRSALQAARQHVQLLYPEQEDTDD
jgi:hypothetical protein